MKHAFLLLCLLSLSSYSDARLFALLPSALKGQWENQDQVESLKNRFPSLEQSDKALAAYLLILAPQNWVGDSQAIYRHYLLNHPTELQALGADATHRVQRQEAEAAFAKGNYVVAASWFEKLTRNSQATLTDYAKLMLGWCWLNTDQAQKAYRHWLDLAAEAKKQDAPSLSRGIGTVYFVAKAEANENELLNDLLSNPSTHEELIQSLARGATTLAEPRQFFLRGGDLKSILNDADINDLYEALNPSPKLALAFSQLFLDRLESLESENLTELVQWSLTVPLKKPSLFPNALVSKLASLPLKGQGREARVLALRATSASANALCLEQMAWAEEDGATPPQWEEVSNDCAQAKPQVAAKALTSLLNHVPSEALTAKGSPYLVLVAKLSEKDAVLSALAPIGADLRFAATPLPSLLAESALEHKNWTALETLYSAQGESSPTWKEVGSALAAAQLGTKNPLLAEKTLLSLYPLSGPLDATGVTYWVEYARVIYQTEPAKARATLQGLANQEANLKGKPLETFVSLAITLQDEMLLDASYRNLGNLSPSAQRENLARLFTLLETETLSPSEESVAKWHPTARKVHANYLALKAGEFSKMDPAAVPTHLAKDLKRLRLFVSATALPKKWEASAAILSKRIRHLGQLSNQLSRGTWASPTMAQAAVASLQGYCEKTLEGIGSEIEGVPSEVLSRVKDKFNECRKSDLLVQSGGKK